MWYEYLFPSMADRPYRIRISGLSVLVLTVWLTTACRDGGENQVDVSVPAGSHSGIPVSAELMRALKLIEGAYVELEIWRNDEAAAYQTIRVSVDPSTQIVEPFPLTLPLGKQTLSIRQFLVDPQFGRLEVAQIEPREFDITGQATLDFSGARVITPLPDEDQDDVPNVVEISTRTDPKNRLSKPVPPSPAQLRSLAIAETVLVPSFDPGHSYYNATVASSVPDVNITALPASGNATLLLNGEPIESGVTKVLAIPSPGQLDGVLTVTVGESKAEYFIKINRSDIVLEAKPWQRSVELNWSGAAATYNIYRYSGKECDLRNYTLCADGALYPNQVSPFTAKELTNGTAYSFQVEAVFPDGMKTYTNVAAARPDRVILDGDVRAIAVTDDGTAYVGGTFTRAMLVSTGTTVDVVTGQPDMFFPRINGLINAVISDGAGGWYIGGEFTRVEGVARFGLAHILADKQLDPNWHPAVSQRSGSNWIPRVNALARDGDVLIIGGTFTHIDDVPRRNLAAVSTTGTILEWSDQGTDGSVNAIVADKGVAYIGGVFANIMGVPRQCLGAMSIVDGKPTEWRADADAIMFNGQIQRAVNALAYAGDILYVGGRFDEIGGENRSGLAAVSAAGQVLPWRPSIGISENNADVEIFTIAVHNDTAYISGAFTHVGGFNRYGLAAIGLDDTASVREWAPSLNWRWRGIGFPPAGLRIVPLTDAIVLAGNFSSVTSQSRSEPRSGVAAVGLDGSLLSWNVPGVIGGRALAINGSKIFIGSDRIVFHEKPRKGLAAFSADGTLLEWNPEVELDSGQFVSDIEVIGETVFFGGSFARVMGQPRLNLAAVTRDGTLTEFQPKISGGVYELASSRNRLFIGGWFSSIDGNERHRLAAFNNGVLEPNWDPKVQGNNSASGAYISSLQIIGDTLYVGGEFTGGGSDPQSNLVAVTATSGTPLERNPGWPQLGKVDDMALIAGTLFVVSSGSIAALGLNTKTQLWRKSDSWPYRILERGGVLFVGSSEVSRPLKTLRAKDGTDLEWQWNLDGRVSAIAASGDTLYVGGSFQSVEGELTGSFVQIPRPKLPVP